MRIIYSALMMLSLLSFQAAAETHNGILNAVEVWSPIDATVKDGRATVVLPQQRVSDRIYISVMSAGLCFRLLINPELLNGVNEVAVLNKHAHQGYVFEGGTDLCNALNKVPLGKSSEIFLLSNTRVH